MKVVLFCGGLGTRLREYSEVVPKPMVNIGYRPILWHLMKYYAHFGHKDFIICLGYRADVIKEYFLNYNECISNDFTLTGSGPSRSVRLANSDVDQWKITFVDTGVNANIGQRLKAVSKHLEGEEMFLANYSDNLTDLHFPDLVDHFQAHDATGLFLSVRPSQSFHLVRTADGSTVNDIMDVRRSDIWINGGFFIFRHRILETIRDGEELVLEPFQRLIREKKLLTCQYNGFWACMDTFKERQQLEDLYTRGEAAWEVWKKGGRPLRS